MAKTHVAEILIGGKNPDELVMKRLKEKDTILNKEKLLDFGHLSGQRELINQ